MSQTIIVYPAGCYGTFFEWIFNFLQDPSIDVPFFTNGSSHQFLGNFFNPKEKLFEHIETKQQFQFSRVHPVLFEKVNEHEVVYQHSYDQILQTDLDFLKQHFDKILVLTYDHDSVLWCENNTLTKIILTELTYQTSCQEYGYTKEFLKSRMESDIVTRIRHLIDLELNSKLSPFTRDNLMGWNKSNIYDFDIWQLRELLSFYWFSRSQGQIQAWQQVKQNNPDILVLSISNLKNQFEQSVIQAANFAGITAHSQAWEKLVTTHQQWAKLQHQINKDALCNKIVNSIIKTESLDWSDTELSIIDEAYIQKTLYDAGIDIKCNNLNVFPTNTQDFIPLLEYTRTAQI
jgi:hypothetical protein